MPYPLAEPFQREKAVYDCYWSLGSTGSGILLIVLGSFVLSSTFIIPIDIMVS